MVDAMASTKAAVMAASSAGRKVAPSGVVKADRWASTWVEKMVARMVEWSVDTMAEL